MLTGALVMGMEILVNRSASRWVSGYDRSETRRPKEAIFTQIYFTPQSYCIWLGFVLSLYIENRQMYKVGQNILSNEKAYEIVKEADIYIIHHTLDHSDSDMDERNPVHKRRVRAASKTSHSILQRSRSIPVIWPCFPVKELLVYVLCHTGSKLIAD